MSLNSLICHVSVFISLVCSDKAINRMPDVFSYSTDIYTTSRSIENTQFQKNSDSECVELTLTIENNQVKIAWKVTDTSTYSHFEILKSRDNKTFDPVALFFTDESLALKDFTYSEKYADNGVISSSYYKIKCVGMDGKILYTKVKNISLKPRR